jgi:hypothetical protein
MVSEEDEWLPELTYILKGDEARPVTRLAHGTRYALGILIAVPHVMERPGPPQVECPDHVPSEGIPQAARSPRADGPQAPVTPDITAASSRLHPSVVFL